jgi:hypothetical protein
MSQEEFLANARKCFELARTAATHEQRQTLVEMVEAWLRAAVVAHNGTLAFHSAATNTKFTSRCQRRRLKS